MHPEDAKTAIAAGIEASNVANVGNTSVVSTILDSESLPPWMGIISAENYQLSLRIEACKNCPELNKFNMCRQCGCFMPAKVRIKRSSCPIGKWGPIQPVPIQPKIKIPPDSP